MRRKLLFLALPALALTCLLAVPESSYAQRFGTGRGGGWGGGWGGGRGYGIGVGNGYSGSGWGYGSGYYGSGYGSGYYGNRGWGYGSPGYYGSSYYGSGYSMPYYGSSYYTPSYTYTQPYYSDGVQGYAGTPTTSSYQAFYPPSNQTLDPNRAMIRVHVSPDAQVMFNGTPTNQSGPQRVFMTPQLNPGEGYSYEISARWNENGQEQSQTRTVRFQAGKTVEVNFMQGNQGQQNLNQGQQLPQTQPLQQQQQVQPQQIQPQQQQPLKQANPRDLPQ